MVNKYEFNCYSKSHELEFDMNLMNHPKPIATKSEIDTFSVFETFYALNSIEST